MFSNVKILKGNTMRFIQPEENLKGNVMKFLIVDDDLASRHFISDQLSDQGVSNTAATGIQALEMFRHALDKTDPYNVVVLDSKLADMDGAAVAHALRTIEDQRNIPLTASVKIVMLNLPWLPGHDNHGTGTPDEAILHRPQPIDPRSLRETIETLTNRSAHQTASAPVDGSLRFLIVDDDRLCRTLLHDILHHYGECDPAVSGEEAIYAVRLALEDGRPYDAITLDIMMPYMDGHETLEKLRAVEAQHGVHGSAGTKVIMSTALDNPQHCIRAFRGGCEAYVTKPINASELLAKLQDLHVIMSETVSS
jgi:two-component system, chemotaxis family, chemotaxis protein CheY